MVESILDALSADERADFLGRARRRKFAAKEVIFHEGDEGNSLHVIESGLVAIRGATPLGEQTTLAVLGPGQTFGEYALVLPSQERSATASAILPTRTLALHRRDVAELRGRVAAIDHMLIVALASTIRRVSAQLMETQWVASDKRLARRILELCDSFGGPESGVTIPFTQDDLAGLIGVTRQTVNKVLRDFEARGLLTLGRGRVVVTDPQGLERRAR